MLDYFYAYFEVTCEEGIRSFRKIRLVHFEQRYKNYTALSYFDMSLHKLDVDGLQEGSFIVNKAVPFVCLSHCDHSHRVP